MEKLKVYREKITLRNAACDMQGVWRPGAILAALQDAAGAHADALGCGRDLLVQENIAWVLFRLELQMQRYPAAGETIEIETFPLPNRRLFFPRSFILRDESGTQIGCAATLWVLMDLNSRRMAMPGPVVDRLPDNSDLTAPLDAPGAPARLDGEISVSTRLPAYTDLDVNGHVNNTRYADWLCDALGIDAMRENCLRDLRINFAAEILPGQEMTLTLARSGNAFHLSGVHEGKAHFEMSGALGDRR